MLIVKQMLDKLVYGPSTNIKSELNKDYQLPQSKLKIKSKDLIEKLYQIEQDIEKLMQSINGSSYSLNSDAVTCKVTVI